MDESDTSNVKDHKNTTEEDKNSDIEVTILPQYSVL